MVLLFDLEHLASAIESAAIADAMGQLWLLTIGTRRGRDAIERIMSTALSGPRFRMASFRIWHNNTPKKTSMILLLRLCVLQVGDGLPSWIHRRFTSAGLQIQVCAALRTQAATILAA